MASTRTKQIEFGDFQTPAELASDVCAAVGDIGFNPASIIEPTCGRGAFLKAAIEQFPSASHFIGVEREAAHVAEAKRSAGASTYAKSIRILCEDFFTIDWEDIIRSLPTPILILGNPPWVTSSTIGSIGGSNLPIKANNDKLRGIDALTGKSNFDISEWMMRENLQWLADQGGLMAVLCKTAVARRLLTHAWSVNLPIESAEVRRIDARRHFGVSVDACLLLIKLSPGSATRDCGDYASLQATEPDSVFGMRDGELVADVRLYDEWSGLRGTGLTGWRSGIKHDCSEVFELDLEEGQFRNKLGALVEVESTVLYPLLKSSDVARNASPRKCLLVPHKSMSESPATLRQTAPKAWDYLVSHRNKLDKRGSSIYRKRPPYSIFGVGDYSFSPWKVAISGLYKKLEFISVGPINKRPVVMDDTCYFFPCESQRECEELYALVQSEPARKFWSAFIFWDAKRPVTAQILNLLDFAALGRNIGANNQIARTLAERQIVGYTEKVHQQMLLREKVGTYRARTRGKSNRAPKNGQDR